jgi:hypothetical protein
MAADDRRLAIERLKIRAEMRSNPDEEEDTGVIDQRAAERMKPISSVPPSKRGTIGEVFRGLLAVLNTLSPTGRLVFLLVLLAVLATSTSPAWFASVKGWLR